MTSTALVPDDDKRKRTRSPAYPFINLETAIKRAREFYKEEQNTQHCSGAFRSRQSAGSLTKRALSAIAYPWRGSGARMHIRRSHQIFVTTGRIRRNESRR